MDSDEGKLFVGGIPWDTTEEKLNEYFSKYGEVSQTVIMHDKTTGRPRGFGFVVFSDPSVLDRVLQDKHTIGDKMVEAKRALSREEQYSSSSRTGNPNAGRSSGGGGGNFRTKKIFVGGLPPVLTEEGFRQYFETFGHVTDVVIMYDQNTQRPRGFGFISFDEEDAVDRVLCKTFHDLNGKLVEVKRALPKDANPGGGGGGGGGGGSGGRGGGYQGYGASGASAGAYDIRMDGNKFMQPQTTGGGFPAYSGYGAQGYGYGAASNGVGYGGYGSYGVAGYGGASAGFGGPAGAYGNPNAPNAGYASGQPGALKTPGYGAAAATWNTPGNGAALSAPMGQSPSGASGYGNPAYGYGNYGGSDGSYPAGYGAAGGRSGSAPNSYAGGGASGGEQQGTGGGYMGSGYGDANGMSGYPNVGWRSDPSAGGYSSGYGSAPSRQTQQQ